MGAGEAIHSARCVGAAVEIGECLTGAGRREDGPMMGSQPAGNRCERVHGGGLRRKCGIRAGKIDSHGMNNSGSRAGASARREYERRREARRARVLSRHPRIGRLLLAVTGAPAHEEAWLKGAEGEERTARRLNKLLHGQGVVLVHDRRMPGSRANIDHLAVGPGGVTVIDTKRIRGKVRVRREGALFSESRERLMVGGRDQTKLVEGVRRQVSVVSELLGDGVAVLGVMCFIESDGLPLFSKPKLDDVHVTGPRGVARLARRDGPHSPSEVQAIAERLRLALPEA